MSTVEQSYRRGLGQWSGQQRVERSAALLSEFYRVLIHKARIAAPSLDERSLRRIAAASLYRTDPEIQRLLSLEHE